MIRRETRTADGEDFWLLISQVEHARLAGQLAAQWCFEPAEAIAPVGDEFLTAVNRHDDGWIEWESHPKVVAESGAPMDFTETPVEDSLAIWRRSIGVGEQIGPLAAYIIAGHFLNLLEHSEAWNADDSAGRGVREWSCEFRARQTAWRDEFLAAGGRDCGLELTDTALEHLQYLDALSLWFCCAERTEPHRTIAQDGTTVSWTPLSQFEVSVEPWPFSGDQIEIHVAARRMVRQSFASAAELQAAAVADMTLTWQLCPESPLLG